MAAQKANFSFEFVVPEDWVLDLARKFLESSEQDRRDIAKAVLDATEVTAATQAAIARQDGQVDLAPYFDHWMGDALNAAQGLIDDEDTEAQTLARCLINQAQAIKKTKELFLEETRRVSDKPRKNRPR